MKKKNVMITAAIVAALVAAFAYLPLPYSVKCPLEVQPRDAQVAYALVPGTLMELKVEAGQKVSEGDLLAVMSNDDLKMSVNTLQNTVEQFKSQLDQLQRQVADNPDVAGNIAEVEELLEAALEQLVEQQTELDKLEIRAPTDGVVMPAPIKKAQPNPDGRLPAWSGSLLDRSNLGAFLEPNDELCRIGDPTKFEAQLAVDQADIDYLQAGQTVRVLLDAYVNNVIETTIEREEDISREPMKYTPQSMSVQAGGKLATKPDASGIPVPLSTTYQVTIPLPGDSSQYKSGLRGRAKVAAAPQSLGTRTWRLLTRTFRFEI